MNSNVIQETSQLMLTQRLRFHEAVNRFRCAGVEHAHTDLIGLLEMYYGPHGDMSCTVLTLEGLPHIPPGLWVDGLRDAVADFRGGATDYPKFLRLVMAAGVQSFATYYSNSRILFLGRNGDFHVEELGGESAAPREGRALVGMVI